MRYTIFTLFFLALILTACNDSTGTNTAFSCEVTLRNADGAPLENYRIQLTSLNKYDGESIVIAERDINDPNDITLTIADYWGNFVREIEYEDNGEHSLAWDGKDEDGETVIMGLYKYWLKSWNDGVVEYEKQDFIYLLYGIEEDNPGILTTSEQGSAMFTNIIPLPGIYCTEQVPAYGENGEAIGFLDLSPNSYIIVQAPDGEIRYTQREMTDGKNSFTITWEELTPEAEE